MIHSMNDSFAKAYDECVILSTLSTADLGNIPISNKKSG